MKKIAFILSAAVFLSNFNAYALDNSFLDMRNKFFEESKEIKLLLVSSKDAILLSSMWDTCLLAISQLDAYFHMLGIFNTIKEKDLNEDALDYIAKWLAEIKRNSELNVSILSAGYISSEPDTQVHIGKLKSYLGELSKKTDRELDKISILIKSAGIKHKKR